MPEIADRIVPAATIAGVPWRRRRLTISFDRWQHHQWRRIIGGAAGDGGR
jgi:hypothetical protein